MVKVFADGNAYILKLLALNKRQCQALLNDPLLRRHGVQVRNEDYRTNQPSQCVSYWVTLGKNGFNNLTLSLPRNPGSATQPSLQPNYEAFSAPVPPASQLQCPSPLALPTALNFCNTLSKLKCRSFAKPRSLILVLFR